MKVLVATERTQGALAEDYSWCVPGELLWLPMACDDDRLSTDRACGCGRGFGGLTSRRATTTAEIVEKEFTHEDLTLAVVTSLTDQGWLGPHLPALVRHELIQEVLTDLSRVTEHFEVGAVVRRDLDKLYEWPA